MECVRIYQRAGRNQEVVALAEKLMSQDVFLLNPALASAIQACAALGDVDKGFHLFDVAVKRGSIPNLGVYSALLAVAGAAGDPQRVQQVLTQMQEAGVEMNDITFHNLMSAYARGGHVTEALALFDKMQKQGIPADEHTYAILMDAHAESGDFEGAKVLMEELKKTSIEPNLVHYNVLLKACGKVSNLTSAFQLYEEMKERKINPDLVTFITMMHAVYHGELGAIDQKKVKAALVGMGMMGAAFVPFINYEEYMMTTLFCGSLVGSMGLAAYMNPDGVIRALYPNTDEPRDDSIIEAFFRRLREEDHCGRSMYLWREMLKFNVPADPRVYDVLVRTCVRKRHPELAYEAVFEEKLPLTDKEGSFVLNLPTTLSLLHSLLAQKRLNMADTLYDAARSHNVFDKVFSEKGETYVFDMRSFLNEQVRSYTIIKLLDELRAKVDSSKGAFVAPNVQILVLHGYELLDRLDEDNASLRTLFSMDDMTRIGATGDKTTSAHYYFRLAVPTERLQKYFETTPANAGKERRL
ncbi:Pre-mRNA-splicing factor [Phytophthora nicotianae]|nr:Pre-mRNA-splicing factor [Phytophthora nicotianae]